MTRLLIVIACLAATATYVEAQGGPMPGGPPPPLPAVPVPPQNPITPEKVLLGKFLFWEEQLSADDSVACGTCHVPEAGGSDPRSFSPESVHPGLDGSFATPDDVLGSLGVVNQDCAGTVISVPHFGETRQVTGRRTPTMIAAAFSPTLFWDGRATSQFVDPETGTVAIPSGGALESQSLGPIMSLAEMSCDTRTWADVTTKLQTVTPMALATNLPADMSQALLMFPTYPDLFQNAFGTNVISARRIAFALASYQRTLIPDQTPYDSLMPGSGPGLMTPLQMQGLMLFRSNCLPCHDGGEFSDHLFHNIGVRPVSEDTGRGAITGNPAHNGQFRTPTLRNVKLRAPFFHNGGKSTLAEVLTFYNQGGDFQTGISSLIQPLGLSATQLQTLEHFLETALTDPRVEQGLPPFDHPTLQPYFRRGDANQDGGVDLADAIATLTYLFLGGTLSCLDAADSNDDGGVDLSDAVACLQRLFAGAAPLPAPSDLTVGPDPTADGLGCQ